MKLYMSLHAEAEPRTPPEQDLARKLVDLGHQQVDRVSRFSTGKIDGGLAGIYHSHAVRARETAEDFGKHFSSREGVVESDGLLPEDDISGWLARCRDSQEDLWIVGHMDNLKRIAGELIARDAAAHPVRFKRGGIACLERDDKGGWGVAWMVIPDLV